MEAVVRKMKQIIERYGPDYMTAEPYNVFLTLTESNVTDRKTAGAILHVLVSGICGDLDSDQENMISLSEWIQHTCCITKRMSDRVSGIFLSLYSSENREEWENKKQKGLTAFLEEDFSIGWDGFAVWDYGTGTIDCHYTAHIVLQPTKAVVQDEELGALLKQNPFLRKEDIHTYFKRKLSGFLDDEFEEYCTSDDYYEPVVEDFEIEERLEEWSQAHGFKVKSCEGEGSDDGYEPKYRRGWY